MKNNVLNIIDSELKGKWLLREYINDVLFWVGFKEVNGWRKVGDVYIATYMKDRFTNVSVLNLTLKRDEYSYFKIISVKLDNIKKEG